MANLVVSTLHAEIFLSCRLQPGLFQILCLLDRRPGHWRSSNQQLVEMKTSGSLIPRFQLAAPCQISPMIPRVVPSYTVGIAIPLYTWPHVNLDVVLSGKLSGTDGT